MFENLKDNYRQSAAKILQYSSKSPPKKGGHMEEYWKTIPFESNYSVSTKGRVKNNTSGKIKSLRLDRNGYVRVTLYPSGITYSVHRLVGLVWLETTYKEGLQIDHLDANRENNDLSNLEWVTAKENNRRIKNRPCKKGSNNDSSIITEEQALYLKYTFDKSIPDLIKETGISREIIEPIRRRETWLHVVDEKLEKDFLAGNLKYSLGKTANLSKEMSDRIDKDIISNKYTTKELCDKYTVSKSSVCRRKRKLLSIVE